MGRIVGQNYQQNLEENFVSLWWCVDNSAILSSDLFCRER